LRPILSANHPAGHWPTACAASAAPTMSPTNEYDAPRSRRNNGRIGSSEPIPVPETKTAATIP